jgi:hypothetical protein
MAGAGYTLVADFPGADHVALSGESSYFKGFIYDHGAR